MSEYLETITIDRPLAATFAYVCDFTHAAVWDPMVVRARRVGDGPVSVGTQFELISRLIGSRTLRLPYEVVRLEPDRRLTLTGEASIMRYTDDITFAAAGNGTRLTYRARAELTGLLWPANLCFGPVFRRAGDNALRGIARAVTAHA